MPPSPQLPPTPKTARLRLPLVGACGLITDEDFFPQQVVHVSGRGCRCRDPDPNIWWAWMFHLALHRWDRGLELPMMDLQLVKHYFDPMRWHESTLSGIGRAFSVISGLDVDVDGTSEAHGAAPDLEMEGGTAR